MSGPIDKTRAADLDDVIVNVQTVRYSDGTPAVRVDFAQQAFDDKSYVDLSADDAEWLARAVLDAAQHIANRQR